MQLVVALTFKTTAEVPWILKSQFGDLKDGSFSCLFGVLFSHNLQYLHDKNMDHYDMICTIYVLYILHTKYIVHIVQYL